jgi:ribulose-5-phosphate 4-epimerase/fuculose-1-phosphate aldolase
VHTGAVLDELARMAALTVSINHAAAPISQAVRDRHWRRKNGPAATYGQKP